MSFTSLWVLCSRVNPVAVALAWNAGSVMIVNYLWIQYESPISTQELCYHVMGNSTKTLSSDAATRTLMLLRTTLNPSGH
eukprot:1214086-Amphidinium_carterae.1